MLNLKLYLKTTWKWPPSSTSAWERNHCFLGNRYCSFFPSSHIKFINRTINLTSQSCIYINNGKASQQTSPNISIFFFTPTWYSHFHFIIIPTNAENFYILLPPFCRKNSYPNEHHLRNISVKWYFLEQDLFVCNRPQIINIIVVVMVVMVRCSSQIKGIQQLWSNEIKFCITFLISDCRSKSPCPLHIFFHALLIKWDLLGYIK